MEKGQRQRNKRTGEVRVWDGEQWVPEKDERGDVRGTAAAFAQGGTFGFQDELQAGLGTMFDVLGGNISLGDVPEQYRYLRDVERQQQGEWAAANPKKAFAAELAGGVAIPGLGGVKALQSGGRSLAAIGAAEGALAGAGYSEAESPLGLLRDTAIGAGAGTLLAPAGAWAGRKLSDLGRGAFRFIRDTFGDQTERQARRAIELAMERDDLTLDEALRRLDELGPEGMLADVGPNLRRTGEIQAQSGGPALTTATEALEQRQAGRATRLAENLEETTRLASTDFHAARRATDKVRREIASPMYEEAYAQPLRKTDELMDLVGVEKMQDALQTAQDRMRGFGKKYGGELRVLNETKRVLYDLEQKALRDGESRLAGDYGQLRRRLVKELDKQNPTYREARNMHAGTREIDDAASYGRELFRGTKTYDDVAELIGEMGDSELQGFRLGAMRGLFDYLEGTADVGRIKQLLRQPRINKLLKEVFPDEEAKGKFLEQLSNEFRFQQTSNKVLGGPATASRLSGQQELSMLGSVPGAMAESAMTGGPPLRTIAGMIKQQMAPAMSDEAAALVSDALFGNMNKNQLDRLLRRMQAPRMIGGNYPISQAVGISSSPLLISEGQGRF